MEDKIYEQIVKKKEYSKIPREDVEMAFRKFERRQVSDLEKIRLTRELLHKVFGVFASGKLLSPKNKEEEWILRKHFSTRERLGNYEKVYSRIFGRIKDCTVIDLGAGVNGFSYKYFPKNYSYLAVESMGQLVGLMNDYFSREKINGKALHLSLFDLGNLEKSIEKTKKPRIILLFKVLDSLEMMEGDSSKKLLELVVPLSEKTVISFATRSLVKKTKFRVNRNWIVDFLRENFKIIDDFEIGGERYIVASGK